MFQRAGNFLREGEMRWRYVLLLPRGPAQPSTRSGKGVAAAWQSILTVGSRLCDPEKGGKIAQKGGYMVPVNRQQAAQLR